MNEKYSIPLREVMDDEVKKKNASTVMEDDVNHDNLSNLNRLKDGYVSIVDKMGYAKFKPYLQRLFHSVEVMFLHEVTEFKKIDAKYQDMVRQCHMYEKTLSILKDKNSCEITSISDTSNTYAFDDFTKVTPYLAPDLLQSTLGTANFAGGSTSLQFRLPNRRSSLSNRQYVSTPLGPARSHKGAVPIAQFDDDTSFVLSNSLGFQQHQPQDKQYADTGIQSEPILVIERKDVSCQMNPSLNDKQIETIQFLVTYQSTQTDFIISQTIACQITPEQNDYSMQTNVYEQEDFSCQFIPLSIDQTTETITTDYQTQTIQTDEVSSSDYSCQMTPSYVNQLIQTIPILTQSIALQSSLDNLVNYDDQQIQTDLVPYNDASTQYESDVDTPDTPILPILLSEDITISSDVEIAIEKRTSDFDEKHFIDEECQTINNLFTQSNESTQTPHVELNDCASQSPIIFIENRHMQTESYSNLYSSSLYIVPTTESPVCCSSKIVILPTESPAALNSKHVVDQQTQCNLHSLEAPIPIAIEHSDHRSDRRSLIQKQLDEKEKQMNRIIEEYAILYGEYEAERRRNIDLTEARDRLADHIKILSDELGDREINQERLLIKSCQQNKLINYMLPQIDCSPMPKKKHHSTNTLRRLLPKFK